MTIEKDVLFTSTNKAGEITCELKFKTLDDRRRVNPYITFAIFRTIKNWIKVWSKTTPKRNKNGLFNNEPARLPINKWEHWLSYLIPENRALAEINFTADFTKQHFVKLNYQLLKPNKSLTYNQALFLLLGLNAIELDDNIIDFPVLNGVKPSNPIESYFWDTPQNQELKQSSFIVDGKITSENLKELADDNGFFIKLKSTNLKTAQKDKNKEIIQNVLLEFLSQSTPSTKHNVNALSQKSELRGLLKNSGIITTEIDEEVNKNVRKPNEMTPRTLAAHLTEIFTSDWWTKQDKSIQSKVKNYQ
jgi:hypothetical protein